MEENMRFVVSFSLIRTPKENRAKDELWMYCGKHYISSNEVAYIVESENGAMATSYAKIFEGKELNPEERLGEFLSIRLAHSGEAIDISDLSRLEEPSIAEIRFG